MSPSSVNWGEWLGSWKQDQDEESERIDRQRAAFGGDTVARIKDLNVLIVGCKGVGVETAKNLILSNVGAVVLVDDGATCIQDLGTNFYLTQEHVTARTGRAEACMAQLKSLNPYCKVDKWTEASIQASSTDCLLMTDNVLGTGKALGAVVVTDLLPKGQLLFLNETCRSRGIAFIMAFNKGVTSSIFSDFGAHHEITDINGEPTQMLAISNMEVVKEKPDILKVDGCSKGDTIVVITVASSDHGLDNGDTVVLDDMRDALLPLSGQEFQVKRVAFVSPTEAKINTRDVSFQLALSEPTERVLDNFERQYNHYQKEHKGDRPLATRTITMFNRLALVLNEQQGDLIECFSKYEAGGLLNQVRPVVTKSYQSLEETLVKTPVPQMLRGEDWEGGKGIEVHLSIAAVLEFQSKHQHWPRLHSSEDAQEVLELAKSISKDRSSTENGCWSQAVSFGFPSGEERELDDERISRFAKLYPTELTGFCAFLGGAAAQEVLKKTGKFTPISQWIHHDEHCLVADASPTNVAPSMFGSRYDHQLAILGKDFMHRISNQRVFLVGCGALGCEYLKGLSLMGVGTGRNGMVHVTDMDRIEVSNLSRQFLFRDSDVGNPKSVSGSRVVKEWNPQLNIVALEKRVGNDSEDFFNDDFWESLTVCWNALDNVAARQYTDAQCLFYSKPLLESGTLGTKCNHEVVLPYRTSSYNDGKESDDNENQIAMCTLRSFPYLPLHCIEFAKQSYFADYFEFGPDQYETFRKDMGSFFEQLDSMEAEEQLKSLTMIQFYIEQQKDGKKIDLELCARIAFDRMVEDFRTSVLNLCHAADEMERSTGEKFWTGTKRRPRAINWDPSTPAPELMEYMYCTTNLNAVVWGLDPVRDRSHFEEIILGLGLQQPEWLPSTDNVNLNEDDSNMEGGQDKSEQAEKIRADLYATDASCLQPAFPQDFEKDEDSNFHIDFLTVGTNLRAWNYDIKASPRHTVKVTAGRIIPALATTTAMVCGLVDIEFCKLVLGLESLGRDKFLNSNINLAAGSGNFTTYSPDPPIPMKTGLKAPHPQSFCSWDKIEVACGTTEMSVEQLVNYIESSLGVSVSRIFSFGSTVDKALYNATNKQRLEWEITIDDSGKPHVSDGVFGQWPQIRMAVQMLSRLPPTSGQRKIFEGQINTVKKALDKTKENFEDVFKGPVSEAYLQEYEPEDEEEKEYFHAVADARDYVKLGVDCRTKEGEEIHLPCIKYSYMPHTEASDRALKRHKLDN